MEGLHRVLSGQALTPKQLRWAGLFVIVWFLMDVIQFVAWMIGK